MRIAAICVPELVRHPCKTSTFATSSSDTGSLAPQPVTGGITRNAMVAIVLNKDLVIRANLVICDEM
jgi:hypothetical protein